MAKYMSTGLANSLVATWTDSILPPMATEPTPIGIVVVKSEPVIGALVAPYVNICWVVGICIMPEPIVPPPPPGIIASEYAAKANTAIAVKIKI
jgi:hypothetical protein